VVRTAGRARRAASVQLSSREGERERRRLLLCTRANAIIIRRITVHESQCEFSLSIVGSAGTRQPAVPVRGRYRVISNLSRYDLVSDGTLTKLN